MSRPSSADPRVVLLLCCGATFMAFLDLSVVNIAFPAIVADFPGVPISTLTWVVSGYAVPMAALLTPAGRLADTIGRDTVFRLSVAAFTAASVLCGVAPDAGLLVAGRVVQGAAAAGMIPAAVGLLLATTAPARMAAAIGAWSAAAGLSAVLGPIVGGLLVEQWNWRSVFLINLPVGVLLLLATARRLPSSRAAGGGRLPDVPGTVLLAVGIGGLVAGLTEGDRWGWGSGWTLGLLACGAALIGLALARSLRHPAPAVDTTLWRTRRFAVANVTSLLFGASMFAWLLAGPLFAIRIWGWSVLATAGALTVGAVASMVASVAAGRIGSPAGQRWVVVGGAVLFGASTALWSTDLLGAEPRFWAVWVPAGLLGGGGLGLMVTGLSTIAAGALPPARFAAGLGMNLTARQLGGALGTAGLAAILAAHATPGLSAFHQVFQACTLITVLAGLAALGLASGTGAAPTDSTPAAAPGDLEAAR